MGIVGIAGIGAVFVALFLALSAVGVFGSERRQVGRSLEALEAIGTAPQHMRRQLDAPFVDRAVTPFLARLTQLARRGTTAEREARIQHRLDLAGSPAGWDVDRVLAVKVLGLVVGVLFALLVSFALGVGVLPALALVLVLGAAGFWGPNMALYQAAYNRTERMRRDLPDALDLLTISVEAGLTFDAAASQVARNTTGPIAGEFSRMLQEMQIGLGRAEALRAMGQRSDLPEMRGFVTAMVQADSFGIPVANVLRVQAKELRVKRSQRAEEAAQKVPVKILFPLIFCILPALFIVVIGPAGINIFRNFAGR